MTYSQRITIDEAIAYMMQAVDDQWRTTRHLAQLMQAKIPFIQNGWYRRSTDSRYFTSPGHAKNILIIMLARGVVEFDPNINGKAMKPMWRKKQ